MKYYLAIDIGASSGRHILAHMQEGRIVLEEVYRFYNGMDDKDGHKVWNTERLFSEILEGMKKCKELGKIPYSMGIDTWGVDFVLLDKDDKLIGDCVAYRDGRTEGMEAEVYRIISEKDLYARTGIQKAVFNTIYQLMAIKQKTPETLTKARTLLMVPDYFHFLLTGVRKQEYTNASTTQLLNAKTADWDHELIELLGFPDELFGELSMPGTTVGQLKKSVEEKVGFNCKVVLPATHDTGSAVMSVPCTDENTLYISSGTWSLMGCELAEANCSEEARKANFTNEGGYQKRYRFLKNIMGLWMIQSVKKEFEQGYDFDGKKENDDFSFSNLCKRAEEETIESLVDANDSRFLNPDSMVKEIQNACEESGQPIPETPWEISRVIYRSLAVCYKDAACEIEAITGKHFDSINIVGGGSNAEYLNCLTAKETKRRVNAGPGEATAIGNIGAQMISDGVFESLTDFRKCVYESFGVKNYLN
ncbi:rhamnulokinase [Butyrivibrio sp. YAB3001]|uniref:rhamnulokinase n=1 Tax=Butyrivibrio sp. YAB3001 TaxID=1520812 RepID=UPI0008F62040|nr:rhamnulokinase [Butyrivibrio sp. YAB3001]SFB71835.1 rhamnulokinase [Butyrivibrio sp. YAB3001]